MSLIDRSDSFAVLLYFCLSPSLSLSTFLSSGSLSPSHYSLLSLYSSLSLSPSHSDSTFLSLYVLPGSLNQSQAMSLVLPLLLVLLRVVVMMVMRMTLMLIMTVSMTMRKLMRPLYPALRFVSFYMFCLF